MANTKNNAASVETRRRLIEAAGEVFSEHGFKNARVRDICHRAGVNGAAVNYHFRDKHELYLEVLRYAHCHPQSEIPSPNDHDPALPIQQRLRLFVHQFLKHVLDEEGPVWYGKLMAREMSEPTDALDHFVREHIRPMAEHLRALLREIMGPGPTEKQIWQIGSSIVGQCLYYCHSRPLIERLNPYPVYSAAGIADAAEHITRFSLAAIDRLRRDPDYGGAEPGPGSPASTPTPAAPATEAP